MSYFNMPPGMTNEDLEYFDSPNEESDEAEEIDEEELAMDDEEY
jgi:hypothetical protein